MIVLEQGKKSQWFLSLILFSTSYPYLSKEMQITAHIGLLSISSYLFVQEKYISPVTWQQSLNANNLPNIYWHLPWANYKCRPWKNKADKIKPCLEGPVNGGDQKEIKYNKRVYLPVWQFYKEIAFQIMYFGLFDFVHEVLYRCTSRMKYVLDIHITECIYFI